MNRADWKFSPGAIFHIFPISFPEGERIESSVVF